MPTTHTSPPAKPATRKQQAYLRALAAQTGTTFTPPADRADASRQIEALKARRPSSRTERYQERRDLDEAMATERGDAARYRAGEITGHGSTARWNVRPLRGEATR